MASIFTTMDKNPLGKKMEKKRNPIVNKSLKQYLDAISKNGTMITFPKQTIQYHSKPSLCHNH